MEGEDNSGRGDRPFRRGGFGGGRSGGRFNRGSRFADKEKPVKPGDEVEVSIESTGKSGDGVARYQNFVIFVKGAEKGQTCKVKVLEVKGSFATAELVQ